MVRIGDRLLSFDSFHLSPECHKNIADQVKAIVDRIGVPKERNVRLFTAVDQCYNWFTSGLIGDEVKYSSNGIIKQMPNTNKYVLYFKDDNNNDNWIQVNNPTNINVEFLIGYMTTGPPPSKYPKVEAIRENGDKYDLHPDSLGYRRKVVHIVRMASLATI